MDTAHDASAQFESAMRAAGIGAPDELVADGKLHQFRAEGDRQRQLSGWYVFHAGSACWASAFGHWRLGTKETWRADGDVRTLTAAEHKRLSAQIAEAKLEAANGTQCTKQRRSALRGSGLMPGRRTRNTPI